jgi:hypothetical protein
MGTIVPFGNSGDGANPIAATPVPPHIRSQDCALTPNTEVSMSGFDKRREGQEAKFAHDEALKFKATARRNKLLGLWAAGKMGLTGADADAYAKDVVKADFEEAGDDDVFRKIRKDFDGKSVALSDHQIRREMEDLMQTALEQVRNEG